MGPTIRDGMRQLGWDQRSSRVYRTCSADYLTVTLRLGHASISITLDTDSHVLPVMQEQATRGIARPLFGT
jgi:hypothetical protein